MCWSVCDVLECHSIHTTLTVCDVLECHSIHTTLSIHTKLLFKVQTLQPQGQRFQKKCNEKKFLRELFFPLSLPSPQSSVPKAWQEFDGRGRMKPSPLRDRVVDVCEEFHKFTLVKKKNKKKHAARLSPSLHCPALHCPARSLLPPPPSLSLMLRVPVLRPYPPLQCCLFFLFFLCTMTRNAVCFFFFLFCAH